MAEPYSITIYKTLLKGGDTDAFTATFTVKRAFSFTRPLYSPLPFDFMRVAEDESQLYLTVNKIPAICSECDYSFDPTKTSTVTASSLSADTLTLTITDPASVGFGLTDLKITLNGQRCNQITGTLASLTCKFNQNSQGNAALPAGNNKPVIHVSYVGYADVTAISEIPIPLTVSSISPSTSGSNGGT